MNLNSRTSPKQQNVHCPGLKGRGGEIKHVAEPLRSTFRKVKRADCSRGANVLLAMDNVVDLMHILDDSKSNAFFFCQHPTSLDPELKSKMCCWLTL